MSSKSYTIVLILSISSIALGAYEEEKYYRTPPPPRILSHKQAQNHDGGFKFHFASENGLAQTEVIAPDGSRNGGYSYVDPHGKTISVKYTAGKEGFRILEGEHIPREVMQEQHASSRSSGPPDDGSYKPERYEPAYQQFKPQYQPQYTSVPQYVQQHQQPQYTRPNYAPPQRIYEPAPISNKVETEADDPKEPEYHDEPGKPYSFGAGYAFQFAS